ncbi:alanine racemase [Oleisolibacter albus]|uniref:alanine racemase n=1 Tax=Oleisolibacter albus TaxID=2171757 RepID=UPI000DF2E6ED|nr:alanine racemase [Oleisolibacter albus]
MAEDRPVHDAYFTTLAAALDRAGLAEPVLVLDLPRLDANADAVAGILAGGPAVRLVVKSLPCAPLLQRLAQRLDTRRYMVFSRAMLLDMAAVDAGADLLLGKPLPVAAAAAYYDAVGAEAPSPHWLVDTPERLDQYAVLARTCGLRLRVSIEIDVGLGRGGVGDPAVLAAMLDRLPPEITVTGLMGYDPHLAKLPEALGLRRRALADSRARYAVLASVLKARLPPERFAALTLNTAGSPTYALHAPCGGGGLSTRAVANEVAIGSAFVKPADFDLDTLVRHRPACFIATPVLKVQDPAGLPGLPGLAPLLARLRPSTARACFIHGGNWLADPVSPPALRPSRLYGRSSNQERWAGPRPRRGERAVRPDDWIFLRPRQSEALFLQFGSLAVFDGRAISGRWPVFPSSA